jgi:branched-chain amino acid transport system substrate-binding protein
MSKLRKTSRVASVIAVTGIAALVLAGCARATPSPGITDTTLSLGISSPLSGATAGPGSCTVAGLDMYLKTQNAAGGFKFGDGKTRQVNLTALDDVCRQLQPAGERWHVCVCRRSGNAHQRSHHAHR